MKTGWLNIIFLYYSKEALSNILIFYFTAMNQMEGFADYYGLHCVVIDQCINFIYSSSQFRSRPTLPYHNILIPSIIRQRDIINRSLYRLITFLWFDFKLMSNMYEITQMNFNINLNWPSDVCENVVTSGNLPCVTGASLYGFSYQRFRRQLSKKLTCHRLLTRKIF